MLTEEVLDRPAPPESGAGEGDRHPQEILGGVPEGPGVAIERSGDRIDGGVAGMGEGPAQQEGMLPSTRTQGSRLHEAGVAGLPAG